METNNDFDKSFLKNNEENKAETVSGTGNLTGAIADSSDKIPNGNYRGSVLQEIHYKKDDHPEYGWEGYTIWVKTPENGVEFKDYKMVKTDGSMNQKKMNEFKKLFKQFGVTIIENTDIISEFNANIKGKQVIMIIQDSSFEKNGEKISWRDVKLNQLIE